MTVPSYAAVALALTRELEARMNIHPEVFWDVPSPLAPIEDVKPRSVLLSWNEFVALAGPHLSTR